MAKPCVRLGLAWAKAAAEPFDPLPKLLILRGQTSGQLREALIQMGNRSPSQPPQNRGLLQQSRRRSCRPPRPGAAAPPRQGCRTGPRQCRSPIVPMPGPDVRANAWAASVFIRARPAAAICRKLNGSSALPTIELSKATVCPGVGRQAGVDSRGTQAGEFGLPARRLGKLSYWSWTETVSQLDARGGPAASLAPQELCGNLARPGGKFRRRINTPLLGPALYSPQGRQLVSRGPLCNPNAKLKTTGSLSAAICRTT